MIISIADSMKKAVIKELDFSFDAPSLESLEKEGTAFAEPVQVKGTVTIQPGQIELDVDVHSKVRQVCSRCLDEFEQEIDLSIDETWAQQVSDDDLDTMPLSEGDTVDLTDLLVQDIISSLPIQPLCSEDCKGLCQECGANLNRETCDCDKEQVNERFAALKDLFKEV
ncbi:DUF177 domain-containing protein [Proteiniclasticum sp. QWL-01]|uniref:YceD family protein n=1 Tax=Proteiniclasticum sp. QWL-01 TaxID=3036945 RepID=UPI0021FD4A6D|nr:DUF177 domain-containing protein [Proteiniclasticum sp. QWL-01]UUM12698.1 DUF177 domain-containing protein [Clostridiaceae bacterium HFYG-1003]WFF74249.1 DUF177 domain-containing protein [Proteiniclasticum sp. QWL-01]